MNWIGFVTLLIFLAAWIGGVVSWFVGAYHMFMFHRRFWQAKPKLREMAAKTFFLMRHFTLSVRPGTY